MDHEQLFNRLQAIKEKLAEQADANRIAWQGTISALGEVENLQRQVTRKLGTKDAVGSAK